ncbi:MAG: hypothetical protein N4A45_10845 [Flavobacteriales bacterium]|jgi:c-di-AMP phosphodiesterase-like protein|nr:hypothetical protein [Flavobacteriales bacterium]
MKNGLLLLGSITLLFIVINIGCKNEENKQHTYKNKKYNFDNLGLFIDTYYYSYKRHPTSVEEILKFHNITKDYYKTDYTKLNDYFDWSIHQLTKYKELIKMEIVDSTYTVQINDLNCILYQAKIINRCSYTEKAFDMQWTILSSPVFHFDNFSAYRGKHYQEFRKKLYSIIKSHVRKIDQSPKNNAFFTYRMGFGIKADCKNTSVLEFPVEYLKEVEKLCANFCKTKGINGISFLLAKPVNTHTPATATNTTP